MRSVTSHEQRGFGDRLLDLGMKVDEVDEISVVKLDVGVLFVVIEQR
jgi:hypothetical protein